MARTTLSALLDSGLRTIEVGATDLDMARAIARRGPARYLCLAAPERWESAAASGDGGCVAPFTAARQASANNAEVLVLSGELPRALWWFNTFAHARFVALPLAARRATVVGLLAIAKHLLRRRVTLAGAEWFRTGRRRGRVLVLARVRRPRATGARRFASPTLGAAGLLEAFRSHGLRYVVLRWFEQLPEVQPGEDLDLLVADEHVSVAEQLLSERPGTIPCDLYSVSGLPGTEYRDMAYYPPALAEQIVARSREWNGSYRVPSGPDHFLSLAYHAVYHKGLDSGLPTLEPELRPEPRPDHDYATALAGIARENGISAELTLEGLDAYLARRGWRPPYDTLVRLSLENRWLARRVGHSVALAEGEHPGVAVFLVREAACARGLADGIVDRLRAAGFIILRERRLSGAVASRVLHGARGGNWGRGPWPRSGGGPAIAVVALDAGPARPRARVRERFPFLSNERLLVKERIRDALNEGLAADERCNMLHSSDNAAEAVEYLRLAMPDEMAEVLAVAQAYRERASAGTASAARAAARPARRLVPGGRA